MMRAFLLTGPVAGAAIAVEPFAFAVTDGETAHVAAIPDGSPGAWPRLLPDRRVTHSQLMGAIDQTNGLTCGVMEVPAKDIPEGNSPVDIAWTLVMVHLASEPV